MEGKVHGTPGGVKQHLVLAKPGYAVGKIGLRSGLVVSALRVSFYRIVEERLDASDAFVTDWIGCAGGSERRLLDGGGEFLVGITAHFQKDLLGLEALRGLRLGVPEEPLPRFGGRVVTSEFAKRGGVTAFRDLGPDGAVLVGLRLGKGQSWGGAIQNIQPIYQLESEYVLGEVRGKPGADVHQVIAKAGYAVGAIQIRRGLVLNAVRLIYCRVDGEQLDVNDRYATRWIGCEGGGPGLLDGHGHPLAGIAGEYHNDMHQLGIATLE